MGEVPLQPVGLRPTTQTLAPGHPARRALEIDSAPQQNPPRDILLLVGDAPAIDVQRRPRRPVPDPLPGHHRLHVCFHRCRQHLHVRLRRRQIVLAVPVRHAAVRRVHLRRAVHDPVQYNNRKRRRHLGTVREEAQVLRRQQERQTAHNSISVVCSRHCFVRPEYGGTEYVPRV